MAYLAGVCLQRNGKNNRRGIHRICPAKANLVQKPRRKAALQSVGTIIGEFIEAKITARASPRMVRKSIVVDRVKKSTKTNSPRQGKKKSREKKRRLGFVSASVLQTAIEEQEKGALEVKEGPSGREGTSQLTQS